MGPEELLEAVAVARMYFIDGLAKKEIGERLGMSRFKVARLIDKCQEEGIVRIEIVSPTAFDAELSEQLRQTYGLRRALVVPSSETTSINELRMSLGQAAASLLTEIVGPDDVVGIAWGRTLSTMAAQLTKLAECPIVQLSGVVGSVSENSLELVRQISAVSGGPAYPIYAPLVLPDKATATSLRTQPGIRAAFAKFDKITKAVLAVGSWSPPDSQLRDALTSVDRNALAHLGVRAEICSTLLRADGTPVPGIQDRSIAISFDQMQAVPDVIIVAGGTTKVDAIRAVLASEVANTLVTDSVVALELLQPHNESP